jgi:tetratricopeptide (TPR) repeat protein
VADGYHLWSERYDRDMADVFAVQEEIARAIVQTLKVKLLGQPDASIVKPGTDDLEAYHLYLKGRHFWRQAALPKAIDCFQKAIERDPQYAQAFAGLADANCWLARFGYIPSTVAFSKAKSAAERAIAIDDRLADGHFSRAMVELFFGWDFQLMEQEFKRAITLNPQYALAYGWLGVGLALLGRHDEAIVSALKAIELEPLYNDPAIGLVYICARRYDGAIEAGRRQLEINPNRITPLLLLGIAYSLRQSHEEAVASLEKGVALSQRNLEMLMELGAAFAKASRFEEARQVLEELRQRRSASYVPAFCFARVHMFLGEMDETFVSLERAFDERDPHAPWVAVFPDCEPVRSDPRFIAILRRVGLESLEGVA